MNSHKIWIAMIVVPAAGAMILRLPVGGHSGGVIPSDGQGMKAEAPDLSGYSDHAPEHPVDLLFIHHSCGGQLMAEPGPVAGSGPTHIYRTHPNGGGLRTRLEEASYVVSEAANDSRIGKRTNIFDWPRKFRDQMSEVLAYAPPGRDAGGGGHYQVVVFKSCFPNNAFHSGGKAPGNPEGPELTVWNAKAAYAALLPEFAKHPEVLFVCLTAPPLAPNTEPRPLWRQIVSKVRGKSYDPVEMGRRAREFNNWLADRKGWLGEGTPRNVAVFDYYDVLTGAGGSDLSMYPTGDGFDSHPSAAGNRRAAEAFVPFLNQAVRRAGVMKSPEAGARASGGITQPTTASEHEPAR